MKSPFWMVNSLRLPLNPYEFEKKPPGTQPILRSYISQISLPSLGAIRSVHSLEIHGEKSWLILWYFMVDTWLINMVN